MDEPSFESQSKDLLWSMCNLKKVEKSKSLPFRKVKPIAGGQLFGPLASLSGPDDKITSSHSLLQKIKGILRKKSMKDKK